MFITFEGIEGSGKTSQLQALRVYLEEVGLSVRVTREPGGTPIGESIRSILLRPDNSEMAALTELFLYGACRSQHVHQVIKPSLERDEILLCDRFTDATLAYQGYGRGLNLNLVNQVNMASTGGLSPALTILLDCPVEVGLKRSWARLHREGKARAESRFEVENIAFHQRVRDGYISIAREHSGRVKVVDGSASDHEVRGEVQRWVMNQVQLPSQRSRC